MLAGIPLRIRPMRTTLAELRMITNGFEILTRLAREAIKNLSFPSLRRSLPFRSLDGMQLAQHCQTF